MTTDAKQSPVERRLRYLASCDAERLSDYQRINHFVSAAIEAADKITTLKIALKGITDRYTSLVNSGDCGFWNPEKEDEVIVSRAAMDEVVK
jgi:hypothetical protein